MDLVGRYEVRFIRRKLADGTVDPGFEIRDSRGKQPTLWWSHAPTLETEIAEAHRALKAEQEKAEIRAAKAARAAELGRNAAERKQ